MHTTRRQRARAASVLALAGAVSCATPAPRDDAPRGAPQSTAPASSASAAQAAAEPAPSAPPATSPPSPPSTEAAPAQPADLEGWLRAHVPQGGRVERAASGKLRVVHVARADETLASIGRAYVDLTTAYTDQELTSALVALNRTPATAALRAKREIVVPLVVDAVPPAPADGRLGWPEDKSLSGPYAHIGMIGAPGFPRFLERVASHGMNAVVVDGKDYGGWITYRSAIPLALETKASSHAVVPSVERLVRVAHARGIHVLLRVSCFHDEWMSSHRPDLAIPGMRNWLNPNNPAAQDYLIAIVDEMLAAGVDEIQLDYVRYPTEHIAHADFGLGGKKTTDVIADFVERVHEHTKAAGVPLSLDIFGVVAFQREVDVRATGQDLTKLGRIVEAISPMVYPSHFADGSMGFAAPGEHPEIVGLATKQAAAVIRKSGGSAIVRSWIQAFSWKAPGYDTSYVWREIQTARSSEGVGWLAWNAGGYYNETFEAARELAAASTTKVAQK